MKTEPKISKLTLVSWLRVIKTMGSELHKIGLSEKVRIYLITLNLIGSRKKITMVESLLGLGFGRTYFNNVPNIF